MSYYHSILNRSYLSNPSLVIDESLFQSLLLALVAQKNVIIRTTATEEQRQLTQIVNVSLCILRPSGVVRQLVIELPTALSDMDLNPLNTLFHF